MYPQLELIRLAGDKTALRRHITLHRAECVAAANQISRPLIWLDQAVTFWRNISSVTKIAAIPFAIFAGRTLRRRAKILGTLLWWVSALSGAVCSWQRR